jgi:hypothetical protein
MSDKLQFVELWSAVTSHRFGVLRLGAAVFTQFRRTMAATGRDRAKR